MLRISTGRPSGEGGKEEKSQNASCKGGGKKIHQRSLRGRLAFTRFGDTTKEGVMMINERKRKGVANKYTGEIVLRLRGDKCLPCP